MNTINLVDRRWATPAALEATGPSHGLYVRRPGTLQQSAERCAQQWEWSAWRLGISCPNMGLPLLRRIWTSQCGVAKSKVLPQLWIHVASVHLKPTAHGINHNMLEPIQVALKVGMRTVVSRLFLFGFVQVPLTVWQVGRHMARYIPPSITFVACFVKSNCLARRF